MEKMSPGEQLQSERELSQRFQVSPMTVRRALHKLSTEGYTSAIPGKGTFVRKCFYAKRADTSSFTDSMLAAGKVASAHLISATLRQATRGEEEALGIDKDTFIYAISRIRFGNDVPLCVEDSIIRSDYFPKLLGEDLTGSLYEIFTKKYSITPMKTRFRIKAALASEPLCQQLKVAAPAPVLIATTATADQNGRVFEVCTSTYRGDSYEITI